MDSLSLLSWRQNINNISNLQEKNMFHDFLAEKCLSRLLPWAYNQNIYHIWATKILLGLAMKTMLKKSQKVRWARAAFPKKEERV
jgi:hypothetical protein